MLVDTIVEALGLQAETVFVSIASFLTLAILLTVSAAIRR